MGHMLRKTAVIAVLILILSSFTLGSTVRVQTVAAAGNEGNAPEQFTQERVPAFIQHDTGSVIESHRYVTTGGAIAGNAGTVAISGSEDRAQMTPDADGISWPVTDIVLPPVRVTTGAINDGNAEQMSDANLTSVIFYINELQSEMPMLHVLSYSAPGNGPSTGLLPVWPRPGPGTMSDNMTLKGKVAMQWPGAAPELFDFLWEREKGSKLAENGSFAVFRGHMTIPGPNVSLEKFSSFGLVSGAAGAIEISSDMVVDLANLPVATATAVNASQTDDIYNNEITAGQTNWHAVSVDSAVKSVNVDLKWQNPESKFRLMIYTPDGKVLGPYYDDADGQTDARINLNVANPSGVASGEWHLKVTDMDTLGSDDYYVKTY
jgi:hypothetical protein